MTTTCVSRLTKVSGGAEERLNVDGLVCTSCESCCSSGADLVAMRTGTLSDFFCGSKVAVSLLPMAATAVGVFVISGTSGVVGTLVVGAGDSTVAAVDTGGRVGGCGSLTFSTMTGVGEAGTGVGAGAAWAGTGSTCWVMTGAGETAGEAGCSGTTMTGELGGGTGSGAAARIGGAGGGDGGLGSEAGGVIAFSSVGSAAGTATTEPS